MDEPEVEGGVTRSGRSSWNRLGIGDDGDLEVRVVDAADGHFTGTDLDRYRRLAAHGRSAVLSEALCQHVGLEGVAMDDAPETSEVVVW